jgi:hypothetical protein
MAILIMQDAPEGERMPRTKASAEKSAPRQGVKGRERSRSAFPAEVIVNK